MEIFVNGNIENVTSTNVQALLIELNIPTTGIAIAVESTVVPKSNWQQFIVEEKSKITIIRATQGG